MSDRNPMAIDELLLLASGLILAAWCGWEYASTDYYLPRTILCCRITGYAAVGYLTISLLLSPMLKAGSWLRISLAPPISARISKNCGIASALAAVVHVVVVLSTYLDFRWRAIFTMSYLMFGTLALAVMLVLLIASFKPLMNLIGWQLWKPLFRLSFAAALLTVPHLMYAPFTSRWLTLGLVALVVLISLLRWLPVRRQVAQSNREKFA